MQWLKLSGQQGLELVELAAEAFGHTHLHQLLELFGRFTDAAVDHTGLAIRFDELDYESLRRHFAVYNAILACEVVDGFEPVRLIK